MDVLCATCFIAPSETSKWNRISALNLVQSWVIAPVKRTKCHEQHKHFGGFIICKRGETLLKIILVADNGKPPTTRNCWTVHSLFLRDGRWTLWMMQNELNVDKESIVSILATNLCNRRICVLNTTADDRKCSEILRTHLRRTLLHQTFSGFGRLNLNFNSCKWQTLRTIILFYNTFFTIIYMFQATSCSTSGGQILLIQHLV